MSWLRKRQRAPLPRLKRANGVMIPKDLAKRHGPPQLLPGQIAGLTRRHFMYLGIDENLHIARVGKPFKVRPMPIPGRESTRPVIASAHGFS